MATYPCDCCGSRYPGQQQTIYPALANGIATQRTKLRCCPQCFDQRLAWLAEAYPLLDEGDVRACCERGCDQAPSYRLFATIYARGHERDDAYTDVCAAHASAIVQPLFFATERPLAAPPALPGFVLDYQGQFHREGKR